MTGVTAEKRYEMQFELMASMMCADYGHLESEVRALEEGGIDSFHIDIMDGRYVPNFAMSLMICAISPAQPASPWTYI